MNPTSYNIRCDKSLGEATDYEVRNPSLNQMIESTRQGMRIIESVPGTEGLPVLLTEFDIDWGTGTSIYLNPNMHYRNSEYFAAFQCAMAKRMLDLRSEFPKNPIQATFLDTFYIPGYRVFEGQRTLITGESVDKPILNALRVLGRLGSNRLAVSEPEGSSLDILATITDTGAIRVMAVNFDESFDYGKSHDIQIRLRWVGDIVARKSMIDISQNRELFSCFFYRHFC